VQYFFAVIIAITRTTIRTINIGTFMNCTTHQHWTYAQVSLLWELARDEAVVMEISIRIGKSCEEIRRKAEELGIPLTEKPVQHRRVVTHPSAATLKEQVK
jgi:hypothetical protein